MTLELRKKLLLWGFVSLLLALTCARPNPRICRSKRGKFPRPGTSCKGYYECENYVPVEKVCADEENFNANKGLCDWEDLYPCLEKKKDKECLRENGLFLKPGTYCKNYYRCCNGKAKLEACSGDSLFDPSKGKCEWTDLYTCIESLSTTEKISSTVTSISSSTLRPRTSTDPVISKSTIQKTTTSNQIIHSTDITDISTKSKIQTTPNQATFHTGETSTISQAITSTVSTSRQTTETSKTLEPKEISSATEISTSQSKITEIPTLQPTTEFSTSQPTTEISTSQSTVTEISTLQPTTTEISISQSTNEISTPQSTIIHISTLQSTTAGISTSQPTSKPSTLRPTTIEISITSQTTSPQITSTHSTDHTILKENKEGELTPITEGKTTPAEVNIMCPEPNGYFPHPTDKHKFVGCVGNVANVLTCPSDLVYKHNLRRCDHDFHE